MGGFGDPVLKILVRVRVLRNRGLPIGGRGYEACGCSGSLLKRGLNRKMSLWLRSGDFGREQETRDRIVSLCFRHALEVKISP